MPFEEKWGLFSNDLNEELQNDRDLIQGWQELFDHTGAGDPYDRILYMFEKRHLLCLLDRLDSMSMAASVEARVPFVDHELVEFVSSIPRKYKMRWRSPTHKFMGLFTSGFNASERLDQSKDILRNSVRGLLPASIINRKKLGFPVPVDKWMASDQVKEILLDPRSRGRGLYKQDKLEELVNNKQNLV
jgi:asparagine synthase (glutamine-hydrolysing)